MDRETSSHNSIETNLESFMTVFEDALASYIRNHCSSGSVGHRKVFFTPAFHPVNPCLHLALLFSCYETLRRFLQALGLETLCS